MRCRTLWTLLGGALLLAGTAAPALAAAAKGVSHAPPPADPPSRVRYVSQRGFTAYLREGPSYAHKILWVYRHRGYPYQVIAQFDVWRRVRTPDGVVGWMSASMLSEKRTVLVTGQGRVQIHVTPTGGKITGLADPGAIAALRACAAQACRITAENIDGWIDKDRIWGADADEIFAK